MNELGDTAKFASNNPFGPPDELAHAVDEMYAKSDEKKNPPLAIKPIEVPTQTQKKVTMENIFTTKIQGLVENKAVTPKSKTNMTPREIMSARIVTIRELLRSEEADYQEMLEKCKGFTTEVMKYLDRQHKRKHDIAKARLHRFDQIKPELDPLLEE